MWLWAKPPGGEERGQGVGEAVKNAATITCVLLLLLALISGQASASGAGVQTRVVQAFARKETQLPEFRLKSAMESLKIFIDGSPVEYSGAEAGIAQFLTLHGRSRLRESDPNTRQFLFGYTKDKAEYLEAAIRLFENALLVNPTYSQASDLLAEAESKLKAYHLYKQAAELIDEHKRELERASRSGNAAEVAKTTYAGLLGADGCGLDAVYLVFSEKPAGLVEDQKIVVYGVVDGDHSYRPVAGWRMTVPKIAVEYYEVRSEPKL